MDWKYIWKARDRVPVGNVSPEYVSNNSICWTNLGLLIILLTAAAGILDGTIIAKSRVACG